MEVRRKDIWFPAKTYGWGWGFPITWQGWLFLAAWFGAFAGGLAYAQSRPVTCFLEGEKPRWRWGE